MKESVEGEQQGEATTKDFFEANALRKWEFIVLLGLIMGLSSLCIDTLLPALPKMKASLGVEGEHKMQFVISMLFLGLAIGQFFYGTLSDSWGRKVPMYAGFAVLFIGTGLTFFAQNLTVMLCARFLQGFGLASPRTLSLAIVRDQFEGEKMANIMSYIRAVFVMIPAFAPSLGLLIITLASWRIIFVLILAFSAVLLIWFTIRMPETLAKKERVELSPAQFKTSVKKVWEHKGALAYTLMAGLITGAFIGFLNCAQPLLQDHYSLGKQFVFYMGGLSACSGVASLLNAWLVKKYSMRFLVLVTLVLVIVLSGVVGGAILLAGWELPMGWGLGYLAVVLFLTGILFGNMNSLAMEPLGEVAGLGSTLVGASVTLIGTGVGTLLGMQYQDNILPIVIGYFICGLLGVGLVLLGKHYHTNTAST